MSGAKTAATTIEPGGYVRGTLRVPGDKSISHRYAILAALADGPSEISNYAPGADCATTLSCLQALGVDIDTRADSDVNRGGVIAIDGASVNGLQPAVGPLDAGNSGTTMRLMAGVLAARPFDTTIIGDASLSRRPSSNAPSITATSARLSCTQETPSSLPAAEKCSWTHSTSRPSDAPPR